jgi:2-oxoisovalerate dehydrogenase E1 component alpha subunit
LNEIIADFQISHHAILDKNGQVISALPDFSLDKDRVIAMYSMMVQSRLFDAKAIALQRTGKLGTYPSVLGQEAMSVGIGAAMHQDDVFCPYYREIGAQFWRGVKMEEVLDYWGGNENGSDFDDPRVSKDFPCCVPIASQTLHAVGVATALQYKNVPRAAVTIVGDGGTSRGDFYEAINVAGVWNLPVVFVVNNNNWAISVNSKNQTMAQTFAQKGIAAGIPCRRIDGNDLLVVRSAMEEALNKAYTGGGPTLIEMLSYRMCDHTTADDASRYRDPQELEQKKELDPINRMKAFLEHQHGYSKSDEDALYEKCNAMIADSVAIYLGREKRSAVEMFDYLYETLPNSYHEQREEIAYYESTNNVS